MNDHKIEKLTKTKQWELVAGTDTPPDVLIEIAALGDRFLNRKIATHPNLEGQNLLDSCITLAGEDQTTANLIMNRKFSTDEKNAFVEVAKVALCLNGWGWNEKTKSCFKKTEQKRI